MTAMNPLRNILNDTPVNAIDVDWNFQAVEDYVATDLVHRDGSVAMEAPLSLLGSPPTIPAHATPKSYVDALLPVGMMMAFGGPVAPSGWALCDGAPKSTTDPAFVALFTTIGYAFGGSGGTFNLPDTRGRVAVGLLGGDASFGVLGAKNAMTARDAALPQHNHPGSRLDVWSGSNDADHVHSMQGHQHYTDHTHDLQNHSHDSNVRNGYNLTLANIPAGQGVGGAWARTNAIWSVGGAPLEFSLRETAVTNDILPGGGHQQTAGPNIKGTGTMAGRQYSDGPNIGATGGISAAHRHAINADLAVANQGVAAANGNLQPYIVVNHIIRIG